MTHLEFTLRLLCGLGAGMLIGFERQWHHKSAGLRTNTLVATGAALFALLSVNLTQNNGDVTRIISQVVTGIGFLGAGIIFKEGISIHGLTTAATVWCSAAAGSLAGTGYYTETLIAVLAIIIVNTLLIPVDKWLENRSNGSDKT
jgi:putative Mg2+ transporter-C (MgtC) family protein